MPFIQSKMYVILVLERCLQLLTGLRCETNPGTNYSAIKERGNRNAENLENCKKPKFYSWNL